MADRLRRRRRRHPCARRHRGRPDLAAARDLARHVAIREVARARPALPRT